MIVELPCGVTTHGADYDPPIVSVQHLYSSQDHMACVPGRHRRAPARIWCHVTHDPGPDYQDRRGWFGRPSASKSRTPQKDKTIVCVARGLGEQLIALVRGLCLRGAPAIQTSMTRTIGLCSPFATRCYSQFLRLQRIER